MEKKYKKGTFWHFLATTCIVYCSRSTEIVEFNKAAAGLKILFYDQDILYFYLQFL